MRLASCTWIICTRLVTPSHAARGSATGSCPHGASSLPHSRPLPSRPLSLFDQPVGSCLEGACQALCTERRCIVRSASHPCSWRGRASHSHDITVPSRNHYPPSHHHQPPHLQLLCQRLRPPSQPNRSPFPFPSATHSATTVPRMPPCSQSRAPPL